MDVQLCPYMCKYMCVLYVYDTGISYILFVYRNKENIAF